VNGRGRRKRGKICGKKHMDCRIKGQAEKGHKKKKRTHHPGGREKGGVGLKYGPLNISSSPSKLNGVTRRGKRKNSARNGKKAWQKKKGVGRVPARREKELQSVEVNKRKRGSGVRRVFWEGTVCLRGRELRGGAPGVRKGVPNLG